MKTLKRNLLHTALLAATLCALPALASVDNFGVGDGHTGPLTVGAANTVVNSYAQVTAPAAPGDTAIIVNNATGFVANDLVLVIQMTGIVPEPPSGGPSPVDLTSSPVGRWELARLSSVAGTTLNMTAALLYSYAGNVTQVIKVPEYTTVTIAAGRSITAPVWNGSTGGVAAFMANGAFTNNGIPGVLVTGKGFRGGIPVDDSSGSVGCSGLDEPAASGGQKGEGVAVTRYGPTNTGRGKVANAGGGGVCYLSGGGGGGNGGAGGQGGDSADGPRTVGGEGGAALTYQTIDHLLMGGGGGAGHMDNGTTGTGGIGGGLAFVRVGSLVGAGSMQANGAPGGNTTGNDAASGGGAGGTLYLRVSGAAACGALAAVGGNGASANSAFDVGPGGSGGGGRILFQKGSGTCAPTGVATNPGSAGVQADSGNPNYGATQGQVGSVTSLTGNFVLPPPVVVTPANASRTNNNKPVYSGTLATTVPAGTQVAIYVDGVQVAVVTPDAAGNWTFTPTVALAEGSHTIRAVARNTAQAVESVSSNINTFTVDTTPPAAPVVVTPANGSLSNNNKPTYTGTAEAGSTVNVFVDGTLVGTTIATAAGTWTLVQPTNLAEGAHTVRATSTDAAGNTSPNSNSNTFTVDTVPPAAPVVVAPANGARINNNTPTYSGTAEANTTVTVYVDGAVIGTTIATAGGTWSFTQPTALPDGSHSVKATSTDAAGNVSVDSNTNTFLVDTVPPPAPVVQDVPNGAVISDNTPDYSGTASGAVTVTIYVNGVVVGTTSVIGGLWTFTQTPALPDGVYTIMVISMDGAGNVSPNSNTNTFTVDTAPPAPPVVVTPADNSRSNNPKPTYTGTAEAGSTVTVYVDGSVVGTTVATATGAWTLVQPANLPEGSHTVRATATDTVGNVSGFSNTNTFFIDLTAPAAPVVTTPANGSRSNNTTPVYTGTAEAGSTVTVYVDGTVVGTAIATAAGTWTFTQPTALAQGSHAVRVTATDVAGNVSVFSNTNTFTVDTTPPAAPVVATPANGSRTNDTTPDYTGTAEAGSTVTVYVDGTVVGTTIATAAGTWSFTPTTALAEGSHAVRATATDVAGNVSVFSNTNTFTVDTTPPAAPVVATPANGSRSNNTTPVYTGTAEAGSTVTVYVDGTVVGTAIATAAGTWTFTQPTALAEGSHAVRATATDVAGNVSVFSNTNTFTVDTTPPAAPVVATPANGSRSNNTTPVYTGTAEAGSTVTVYVDGTVVGTAIATAAGTWTFTQPTALAEGSHAVRATATDVAGNVSVFSNTNTFTVDLTAPAAPVVATPANGSRTNDTTPDYTGTAEAGSTVTVYVDGTVVGTTIATAAGTWSFTPTTALAEGSHAVRATATDVAGNVSVFSNTNTFTVDTTPPAAPVVATPANGSRTNDTTPDYTGTAEAGSTVTIYVDGTVVGTAIATAAGTWSFTPTTPLAEGSHAVRATATDVAGNVSVFSNTNTFTVDTTPPAAPVVATPANGSRTNDTTPDYTGTAEAGSTVTIYVDGSVVGTAIATAAGTWSFTPTTPLAEGSHAVRATATDVAGNISVFSNTNTFTVDTTPPAAPVVQAPANGSRTKNQKPVYTGTAEAGSTVTVYVDNVAVGTTIATAAGTWSFTQLTNLAEGPHTVKATSTDVAGNISVFSNINTFTVDLTAPAAPVVQTPSNGSRTNDTTPTYSGTAEPGSTVTISVDGTVVGTALADASGSWAFTPTTALLEGAHTVNATATDVAGNTSAQSNTNNFTVDLTAPTTPTVATPANGSRTNDTTPTYTGTADPGSTVTIYVDGVVAGTALADASGNWNFTPTTPLAAGPHTVSATATDTVGNTSGQSPTNTFTVDVTAPAAPVVATPANGSRTNDTTPTYSGTAEAGSTVTISVDGAVVGTATADASGNWNFTPTTPLAAGAHTVNATATDVAGNTSPQSNTNTFTVDLTPPGAPVVTAPANGSSTNDTTPTYTGTAEAGSTVVVTVDGTVVGTTTADASGNWSVTPSTPLPAGPHTVTAAATDAAGNAGPSSAANTFTVDLTAPAAPVVTAPANGAVLGNNLPTYTGTAEANSTVSVYVDGALAGTTPADASGAWSLTPTTGLANGSHTVKATSTDAAGNVSPDSNTNTFTVDATVPAAPVVTGPANDSVTSDNTPTITGTGTPGTTVTVILNGNPVGTATVDAAGNWSVTPTTPLPDGPYTLTATATNPSGNVSPPSSPVRFVVDTAVPDTTIASGPSGDTDTADASFDLSSSETGVTYECSLDGGEFVTCSDPAEFTGLANGEHTLQVRARDSAGNVDPTPATATWNVNVDQNNLNFRGGGCASTGSGPSALALMGLAVLSALLARRRRA